MYHQPGHGCNGSHHGVGPTQTAGPVGLVPTQDSVSGDSRLSGGGGYRPFHHLDPDSINIMSDHQVSPVPPGGSGPGKGGNEPGGANKMVNFASNGDDLISPSSPTGMTVTNDSASVTGVVIPHDNLQHGGSHPGGVSRNYGSHEGGSGSVHRPMANEHYPSCDCCRIDEQPYSMRDFTPPGSVIQRSEVGAHHWFFFISFRYTLSFF